MTRSDIPSGGLYLTMFRSQLLSTQQTHKDVPTRRLDSLKTTVKVPIIWSHMRHWN